MALIKEFMTQKGPATYWVLGLLQIDNFSKTAYARLYGFYNKEYADRTTAIPVITLEINITPDIYSYYFEEDILKLEGASPLFQAYQVFKDFEISDGTGDVYNFKDAEDEINEVVEPWL